MKIFPYLHCHPRHILRGEEFIRGILFAGKWATVNLSKGSSSYPWGDDQIIKFQRMKFNGIGFNTLSIPHPSRFGFGYDPERLSAILKGLEKCGLDINK